MWWVTENQFRIWVGGGGGGGGGDNANLQFGDGGGEQLRIQGVFEWFGEPPLTGESLCITTPPVDMH